MLGGRWRVHVNGFEFSIFVLFITWNVDKSRLAKVKIKLNVAAAKEMVRGGMHSPVINIK